MTIKFHDQIDFMMKYGIKGIIGGGSALLLNNNITKFHEAHLRAGKTSQPGTDLCLGISFHIAETREKAIKEATPFYQEHAKMFGPLGFLGKLTDEQVEAISRRGGIPNADIPSLEWVRSHKHV